jgi:hypothetical protein
MSSVLVALVFTGLLAALIFEWRRRVALQRLEYIRGFELPFGLFERLRKQHPQLSTKDCQLVAHALRQFFLAYAMSGTRFVAMPSQVVDDLWHEFILYTKNYDAFCRKAFGKFLHHTPAVVLGSDEMANEGLRRCWRYVCVQENINPRQPSRLPLLFAIDGKLKIVGGFRYVPDCESVRREGRDQGSGTAHCGSAVGNSCSGGDGGAAGPGDSSSSGDGGDSGCGGGGCGGGD